MVVTKTAARRRLADVKRTARTIQSDIEIAFNPVRERRTTDAYLLHALHALRTLEEQTQALRELLTERAKEKGLR